MWTEAPSGESVGPQPVLGGCAERPDCCHNDPGGSNEARKPQASPSPGSCPGRFQPPLPSAVRAPSSAPTQPIAAVIRVSKPPRVRAAAAEVGPQQRDAAGAAGPGSPLLAGTQAARSRAAPVPAPPAGTNVCPCLRRAMMNVWVARRLWVVRRVVVLPGPPSSCCPPAPVPRLRPCPALCTHPRELGQGWLLLCTSWFARETSAAPGPSSARSCAAVEVKWGTSGGRSHLSLLLLTASLSVSVS